MSSGSGKKTHIIQQWKDLFTEVGDNQSLLQVRGRAVCRRRGGGYSRRGFWWLSLPLVVIAAGVAG